VQIPRTLPLYRLVRFGARETVEYERGYFLPYSRKYLFMSTGFDVFRLVEPVISIIAFHCI